MLLAVLCGALLKGGFCGSSFTLLLGLLLLRIHRDHHHKDDHQKEEKTHRANTSALRALYLESFSMCVPPAMESRMLVSEITFFML